MRLTMNVLGLSQRGLARPIRRWLTLIALPLLLSLAACTPISNSNTPILDSATTFPQEVVAELPTPQTYRLGLHTEVTGAGAQIGDLTIRAARLAVEEINDAGGVNGIPLELVVRDVRSDPQIALEQYRQAIAQDHLVALLGPLKSAYATLMVPEHRHQHLPMFIGATNYTLTEQGAANLFRARPSDRLGAAAMVTIAIERLNAQRVGLIYDSDAFGSGGAELIRQELSQRGRTLAADISYRTETSEFDPFVRQLAEAQVDMILIYGTNQTDVGRLLRTIRYWDLEVPIFTSPGGSSVVTHNVAAEAQDGILAINDGFLKDSAKAATFQAAFVQRFGVEPDTYVAWAYDAVYLLADILAKHPTATDDDLNDLIRQSTFAGVQGVYRFDETGEGLHSVTIVLMNDGIPQPVGTYSQDGFFPNDNWQTVITQLAPAAEPIP
ncbi:MAG: ABC transporter substrate-binding protein [Anaerolineaceae bacterium]|nr:ABC transporter substrate-binding protein [Anaerolineaceae bacterium]MCB9098264.1 ABC transporter substrate-binding protein [Anaerolineales bacterium]